MSTGPIIHDLLFALRTARKNPAYVLTAVCTLALGIGANTVIFSIVSGVLLRPLPFPHPESLVQLTESDPRNGAGAVAYPDLVDWREQGSTFEAIAAYGFVSKNLDNVAEPERVSTVWAERNLFRMLGVSAIVGRTFRDDDPPNVAVFSSGLWRRRFGSDPACIGRKISLDGASYMVVGVMPEGFQFPYRFSQTEIWIPWQAPLQYAHNRNYRVDSVAARLKPGVTIARARTELSVISERLAARYPDSNRGRRALVTPLSETVTGSVRPALLTLLGAVAVVLLIACANVTNLLLARAASRTREIAIRAALGASRVRLVQQLLTESLLLSGAGGIAALFLAVAGNRLLLDLAASRIPRAWEISLDWRVFFFLLAVSLGTGILFGLLPAVAAASADVQQGLKDSGGNRAAGHGSSGRRLRNFLVVAEIAMAFMLLGSAGILLRGFLRLQSTPAGFQANNVLTLHLTISLKDYQAPGSYGRYLETLEDSLRQIPGVRATGFIQYLPLENWGWTSGFAVAGRATQSREQQAELRYVSPGYFHALGIPLRRGRFFTDRDTSDSPGVILINEALAHRFFPNEDPIGKRTDRGVIVGVVGDVHQSSLERPAAPEIYYAFEQNTAATSDAGVSLIVSTLRPPELLANAVRAAIHRSNPNQVIFNIKTMNRVIADSFADVNLYLWLIGIFAGIAVLLALGGIYGVVSNVVAARTREFGIRLALGARGGQLLRLVLRDGALLIGFGLVFGGAGSLALGRLLKSFLASVPQTDPVTLAAAATLLAAVALISCWIPARRALEVDPNIVLKYE